MSWHRPATWCRRSRYEQRDRKLYPGPFWAAVSPGVDLGMSLFEELKRRNVIRVGIAYAVGTWLLAQAADLVLDVMGAPDIILRSLVAILALGFIPAVLFAWAFEMTPEGIKKEKDVIRDQSITNQTAKKLDIATIALVIGAVVLLAVDRMLPEQGSLPPVGGSEAADTPPANREQGSLLQKNETPETRSIAVLPFVDMSPAKDNEYFTDGLTEELLNILAQIKSLQVAGRTSSFAFKGKTEDLRDIGEKLNVNTLLEGSVRKDDQRQRIRVTVQLINVADGYHIWSDTYDRDLEDIFAIQEDIALRVAEALKINLLGEEEARIVDHSSTDLSAYELYLQGIQSFNTFSYDGLRDAELLLKQALVLDPEYQPASLALVKVLLEQEETGVRSPAEINLMASPLLDAMLENDPHNSDAHALRARLFEANRNFAQAHSEYQLALNSNPRNVNALSSFGRFLFQRDQIDEGLGYLQQAAQIEPYDIKLQWDLCITNAQLLNDAAARRECGRLTDISASNPMQYYGLMYLHEYQGEFAEAMVLRELAIKADPADPELTAGMALTWLDLGDIEQAKIWLDKTARINSKSPAAVVARMAVLMHQEQFQEALGVAQQAYEDKLPNRHGSNEAIYRLLARDRVQRGDFDGALEILNGLLPAGLDSPLQSDNIDDASLLSHMALVTKLQNPASEQAIDLLNHADELNQRNSGRKIPFTKPLTQATIDAARGDKEAAIRSLKDAIEKGWRWDWQDAMYRDIQFQSLHDEAEFKELIIYLEADMEAQRLQAYERLGLPQ